MINAEPVYAGAYIVGVIVGILLAGGLAGLIPFFMAKKEALR